MDIKEEHNEFFHELDGRGFIFQNKNWLGGCFEDDQLQVVWEMWQAAKAQAVLYEPGSFKSSHEIIINETKSELIDGYDIAKEDEYLLESLVYRGVCIGKAQAVSEESKRQGGYYIRDLRNQPGNCMKFWYQGGYGTKHKNFFWCETLEQAKKYQGRCGWFEIWHAPYIDSLIEHTVDFQLADRSIGFVDLEAQEQKG